MKQVVHMTHHSCSGLDRRWCCLIMGPCAKQQRAAWRYMEVQGMGQGTQQPNITAMNASISPLRTSTYLQPLLARPLHRGNNMSAARRARPVS